MFGFMMSSQVLVTLLECYPFSLCNHVVAAVTPWCKCCACACAWQFNGHTPLYTAASRGHSDVVDVLLKHGAEVNQSTVSAACIRTTRQPPAALQRPLQSFLLPCPIIHAVFLQGEGNTPLFIARLSKHEAIAELLVRHGGTAAEVEKPSREAVVVLDKARHTDDWAFGAFSGFEPRLIDGASVCIRVRTSLTPSGEMVRWCV